uniref:Solute carrier family 25 member 32 n=1 Tax=Schmidtea mediterranea TaxID=79327 RepID=A0A0H3YJ82_SCHMD|nr:slc25a-28 [Schmidtea mediterranea]
MSANISNRTVQWEHLVSGMSAGIISTLVLHPLDLIKIRFQVNEGTGVAIRPKYYGMVDACRRIVKVNGFSGLYQGVMPNTVGSGCAWGFYFIIYNSMKEYQQKGNLKQELSKLEYMTMAALSGALTLAFTNPIWVVKTRLCLQYDKELFNTSKNNPKTVHYSGMINCFNQIYKTEGMRGLYKGFIPGLFGTSHGAVQFVTYESMKNFYSQWYYRKDINTKLNTWEYLLLGCVSKLVAASTTYPYQVVRSRLQDQHRVYGGIIDVIFQLWKYEGIYGFYKGLLPSLIRVTPASGIVFVVYETMSTYLLPNKHL